MCSCASSGMHVHRSIDGGALLRFFPLSRISAVKFVYFKPTTERCTYKHTPQTKLSSARSHDYVPQAKEFGNKLPTFQHTMQNVMQHLSTFQHTMHCLLDTEACSPALESCLHASDTKSEKHVLTMFCNLIGLSVCSICVFCNLI